MLGVPIWSAYGALRMVDADNCCGVSLFWDCCLKGDAMTDTDYKPPAPKFQHHDGMREYAPWGCWAFINRNNTAVCIQNRGHDDDYHEPTAPDALGLWASKATFVVRRPLKEATSLDSEESPEADTDDAPHEGAICPSGCCSSEDCCGEGCDCIDCPRCLPRTEPWPQSVLDTLSNKAKEAYAKAINTGASAVEILAERLAHAETARDENYDKAQDLYQRLKHAEAAVNEAIGIRDAWADRIEELEAELRGLLDNLAGYKAFNIFTTATKHGIRDAWKVLKRPLDPPTGEIGVWNKRTQEYETLTYDETPSA